MKLYHCGREMARRWGSDVYYCLDCGAEVTGLHVHKKWGGLIRSLSRLG